MRKNGPQNNLPIEILAYKKNLPIEKRAQFAQILA